MVRAFEANEERSKFFEGAHTVAAGLRVPKPLGDFLVLDAVLEQRSDLRYTPIGLPAFECVLRHASVQHEAGGERKVECELAAIAFGESAKSLAMLDNGTAVRCKGFLARRYRTGVTIALQRLNGPVTDGSIVP